MLIFYRFEPDDAYKKNAYKKKSVYVTKLAGNGNRSFENTTGDILHISRVVRKVIVIGEQK